MINFTVTTAAHNALKEEKDGLLSMVKSLEARNKTLEVENECLDDSCKAASDKTTELQEIVDDQSNLMGWAEDELKRVGNGKWQDYYSLPMNLSTHIETVLKDLQHAAKHRSDK